MTPARKGILGVLIACVIWGLAPLYYRYLSRIPAAEMLAQRTLWSAVTFGVLMAGQGRLGLLVQAARGPELPRILLTALLISFNWGVFIWAIQNGHAIEAGLGYYIFPLMAVVLGVATFGERLGRLQAVAVGLAAAAVGLLTWGLGVAPWLALALAASFAAYTRTKKGLRTDATASVTLEVLVLVPFALAYLIWLQLSSGQGAFGRDTEATLLLPLTGIITAGPLILFSSGAQKVRLSTLGLAQYLNPTLQVICAALIMGDPFTRWHVGALGLIWAALILYSAQGWRQDRRAAKPASTPATSATTVN